MGARPSRSRLCPTLPALATLGLLAAFGAGNAAAADAPPRSRETTLGLSPRLPSALPVDLPALAQRLCGDSAPPLITAKCHMTDYDPKEGFVLQVEPERALVSSLVWVVAHRIESSCGPWQATLTLDPAEPQPVSSLRFEAMPEEPERGLFAGAVEIAALLRLAHGESGRAADFPLRIVLGLIGPWLLSEEGVPIVMAHPNEAPSDLCIPAWIVECGDEQLLGDLLAKGCKICFPIEKPFRPDS